MLSKKQQKKLKKLEKLRQEQEQQQNAGQQQDEQKAIIEKPSKDQNQKAKHKHSHDSITKHKPQQQQQQQSQQQQQVQQNGDIDFNQLQQIDNNQKIDVTFLIAQIRQEYYHSMKTVLLRYGQIIGETESQVAGEILEKGNLGNVVVAEDDQEQQQQEEQNKGKSSENQEEEPNDQLNVYSVLTILPSQVKITAKLIKQALTSLEKHKLQLPKTYAKCQQILKTPKSISLLLSARLPNLPSFIVCDSHEVFVSDLEELKKTQPKHPIFDSQYILNVSEVEITNSSTKLLNELIFSKFEDYQFCQKSLCWWVGENIKSQRQKADLRKLYFVMKLKDYFSAAKNIKAYLQQAQN